MTRRVSSLLSLFTKAFHTRRTRNNTNMPNTKQHHKLVLFRVRHLSLAYHMHRTRNDTFVGVFSCSAPFLHPTTHETTPTLVSSCVWHHFLALRARNHTNEGVISCSASFLSTTTHVWHWAWNNTLVGVVLCLASFLCPITDAKYKMIPLSMSFRVWHLFHPPSTKQHPCWCCFVLRSLPSSSNKLWGGLLNIFCIII